MNRFDSNSDPDWCTFWQGSCQSPNTKTWQFSWYLSLSRVAYTSSISITFWERQNISKYRISKNEVSQSRPQCMASVSWFIADQGPRKMRRGFPCLTPLKAKARDPTYNRLQLVRSRQLFIGVSNNYMVYDCFVWSENRWTKSSCSVPNRSTTLPVNQHSSGKSHFLKVNQ